MRLVILSLLATASVAHADPVSLRAAAPAAPAPATDIAAGVSFGSVDNHAAVGASAEVGERLSGGLSVHGSVATGADGMLFDGSGTFLQVRGGFDLSSCATVESVCAYVGVDAGYEQTHYRTWSFDGEMSSSSDGAIGALRAGLDIGGKHVRWRPGVDVTVIGANAAAITQSIVYRF